MEKGRKTAAYLSILALNLSDFAEIRKSASTAFTARNGTHECVGSAPRRFTHGRERRGFRRGGPSPGPPRNSRTAHLGEDSHRRRRGVPERPLRMIPGRREANPARTTTGGCVPPRRGQVAARGVIAGPATGRKNAPPTGGSGFVGDAYMRPASFGGDALRAGFSNRPYGSNGSTPQNENRARGSSVDPRAR